jgi:hypothetical protein
MGVVKRIITYFLCNWLNVSGICLSCGRKVAESGKEFWEFLISSVEFADVTMQKHVRSYEVLLGQHM